MKLIGMFLGITVAYVTSAPPGKPIPYFAGPFRIVVRKMHNKSIEYTTTGEMWGDVRFTHFRHGQLQWFWGTVRHSVPWDDSLTGIIYVSQWSNNQWKPNAFRLKFSNVCSAALLHAKDLMVLIHGEEGARCPIREGTWQIPNKSLDFVFSKFPIFPYGRWLGTGVLSQGTTNLGLMTVEVDIIPRV